MSHTTYTVRTHFDSFRFSADLTEASAPIRFIDPEGEESSTPYQTADARHSEREAALLVLRHLGRDYYAAPDDDRDSDEILQEIAGASPFVVEAS